MKKRSDNPETVALIGKKEYILRQHPAGEKKKLLEYYKKNSRSPKQELYALAKELKKEGVMSDSEVDKYVRERIDDALLDSKYHGEEFADMGVFRFYSNPEHMPYFLHVALSKKNPVFTLDYAKVVVDDIGDNDDQYIRDGQYKKIYSYYTGVKFRTDIEDEDLSDDDEDEQEDQDGSEKN